MLLNDRIKLQFVWMGLMNTTEVSKERITCHDKVRDILLKELEEKKNMICIVCYHC